METFEKESMIMENAKSASGKFGSISYYGENKMNVGGRSHDNYLYGRVTKIVTVSGIQFGVNYENKKNNELERKGFERDFVSSEMKGCKWEIFPCIVRAIKSDKLQLRVTCTKSTKFNTSYFVDGRVATDEELNVIRKYTPSSVCPDVFNITIEKIVDLKFGAANFTDYELKSKIDGYRLAN